MGGVGRGNWGGGVFVGGWDWRMSYTGCLLRTGRIPYGGGVLELGGHQRGWGSGGVGHPSGESHRGGAKEGGCEI